MDARVALAVGIVLAASLGFAPTAAAKAESSVTFILHEFGPDLYHINPPHVSIPEGYVLNATVINPAQNNHSHNFVVRSLDFESPDLEPGTGAAFVLRFPGPGNYTYESTTNPVDGPLGMRGYLNVVANESLPGTSTDAKNRGGDNKSPGTGLAAVVIGVAAFALSRRRSKS